MSRLEALGAAPARAARGHRRQPQAACRAGARPPAEQGRRRGGRLRHRCRCRHAAPGAAARAGAGAQHRHRWSPSPSCWAAVAQLDEVTRGEGKVIPSRQVQILQSIDGGLVSEILVHEGDVVEPDQLLIKIDETRFASSVKENRAQYFGLVARAARLKAISDGKPFVPPPEVVKDGARGGRSRSCSFTRPSRPS